MRLAAMWLALAWAEIALGGAPCGTKVSVRRQVVVAGATQAVVVPFAVPVAVPVATVRVPSVLYAYGTPGAEAVPPRAADAPPAEPVAPAEAALRGRCLACHRGAAAKGGLMIFDDAGGLRPRLPRHVIWDQIARGKMPPADAEGLSDEQRRALEDWARLPRDFEW